MIEVIQLQSNTPPTSVLESTAKRRNPDRAKCPGLVEDTARRSELCGFVIGNLAC